MLIFRWQAPIVPDIKQIRFMFEAEGLAPIEEVYPPDTEIGTHRHPFDEVRTVASGEVIFDVDGNKLLLRAGDKIVIPSNTKHSFKIQGHDSCVCIVANKTT